MTETTGDAKIVEMLATHYQKTYDVTYELWKTRNKLFVTLAGVAGGGTLLFGGGQPLAALLIVGIGKQVGVDLGDASAVTTFIPVQALYTMVMAAVFHFVLDLYRHTLDITRSYLYLGGLESEIRRLAGFPEASVAFTREDRFYNAHRPRGLGGRIRLVYTIVLGALLAVFMVARFASGLPQTTTGVVFLAADIAIGALTVGYFIAFALQSVVMKPPAKKT